MTRIKLGLEFFLLPFSLTACTQSVTGIGKTVLFVGSSPCDSFIRSTLDLAYSGNCEFVKWQLSVQHHESKKNSFRLQVQYGQTQPNTNGFKNGGESIVLNGVVFYTRFRHRETGYPIHELKSSDPAISVWVVEVSPDLWHIADNDRNLLVGNGGWGYVLNREK